MKKNYIVFILLAVINLESCSNSQQSKAESAVKAYLEDNLNNPYSYCPISFSKIETIPKRTMHNSTYKITHIYSILNSDSDKVKMNVSFLLDNDFKVKDIDLITINGDYGLMEIIEQ